jgi:hypothetical protein
MPPQADEFSTGQRPVPRRAWAGSIAVLGLLLFTWPFLRTPALPIGPSYAHLLGAWAIVVLALGLLARALGPGARRRGGGA